MYEIENIDLKKLTDYLNPFVTEGRKELIEKLLSYRTRYLTLGLENVYHTQNASALVRTAECFGLQDIHIIEDTTSYKMHRGIAKGAQQWMTLHKHDQFPENRHGKNAQACLQSLKDKGYRIVSTLPTYKATPMDEIPTDKPLAFFFGTEKEGLTEHVKSNTDIPMTVPMVGCTESLNVSVAAGIVIQYFTQKIREENKVNWQLSETEKLELRTKWYLDAVTNAETHLRHFENKYA